MFDKQRQVRMSISKVQNGKATGPSRIVSKILKVAEEAEVDMVTDLLNQIIVEGFIPANWKLGTTANCYKKKRNTSEIENYKGLKLTDQILRSTFILIQLQ